VSQGSPPRSLGALPAAKRLIVGASALATLALAAPASGTQITITRLTVPTPGAEPFGIARDASGGIWFTERRASQVARIDGRGVVTEFPTPTPNASPLYITAGADGNMWFTEQAASKIARVTPSGTITEFPTATPDTQPIGITSGPDGNIWYTARDRIGRMTTSGLPTEFTVGITPSALPYDITTGPDGALWFTEKAADRVGRITTAGQVREFRALAGSGPEGIVTGPDRRLWVTAADGDSVMRITTRGTISEFLTPSRGSAPSAIARGPFGELWLTERRGNRFARVTRSGVVEEFGEGLLRGSAPTDIATGSGRTLWLAGGADWVVRLTVKGAPSPERNLPPPVLGKRVNVAPAKGKVFIAVRRADSAAGAKARAPRFVRLRRARQIPIGSLIDTRRGRVRLLTAEDSRGTVGIARAQGSIFQVVQSESGETMTELRLTGGRVAQCDLPVGGEAIASRKLPKNVIRKLKLWVHKGGWATKGRKAKGVTKAYPRGSQRTETLPIAAAWTTVDRCPPFGTSIDTNRGEVEIRALDGPLVVRSRGRVIRRLRSGNGRFRTRGKHSAGTVRG
jgi:virginiamycin B lyase